MQAVAVAAMVIMVMVEMVEAGQVQMEQVRIAGGTTDDQPHTQARLSKVQKPLQPRHIIPLDESDQDVLKTF